jgi:hypothetical protein
MRLRSQSLAKVFENSDRVVDFVDRSGRVPCDDGRGRRPPGRSHNRGHITYAALSRSTLADANQRRPPASFQPASSARRLKAAQLGVGSMP